MDNNSEEFASGVKNCQIADSEHFRTGWYPLIRGLNPYARVLLQVPNLEPLQSFRYGKAMNGSASPSRPALTLVPGASDDAAEWSWFCGHCAAPAPGGEPPVPNARVCRSCGLGLLLETREDAAPGSNDAFLVVDSSLRVHGLSEQAEALLGVREDQVVHQPLAELLVPADVEGSGRSDVAAAVADAVGSSDRPSYSFVRPWNTYGVRVRARIVACGPPRAALIVLERSRHGQLHAVTSI